MKLVLYTCFLDGELQNNKYFFIVHYIVLSSFTVCSQAHNMKLVRNETKHEMCVHKIQHKMVQKRKLIDSWKILFPQFLT